MATSKFYFEGVSFVTNSYAAILRKQGVNEDFHFVQDFFQTSEIGHALTRPQEVYGHAIFAIWNNKTFYPGCTNVSPLFTFPHDGETLTITPSVVHNALNLPNKHGYTLVFNGKDIRGFFANLIDLLQGLNLNEIVIE